MVMISSWMSTTLLISLTESEMLCTTLSMLGERAISRTSRINRRARITLIACKLPVHMSMCAPFVHSSGAPCTMGIQRAPL